MTVALHYTVGARFGRLTILERAPRYKVVCQCDCLGEHTERWFRTVIQRPSALIVRQAQQFLGKIIER